MVKENGTKTHGFTWELPEDQGDANVEMTEEH